MFCHYYSFIMIMVIIVFKVVVLINAFFSNNFHFCSNKYTYFDFDLFSLSDTFEKLFYRQKNGLHRWQVRYRSETQTCVARSASISERNFLFFYGNLNATHSESVTLALGVGFFVDVWIVAGKLPNLAQIVEFKKTTS